MPRSQYVLISTKSFDVYIPNTGDMHFVGSTVIDPLDYPVVQAELMEVLKRWARKNVRGRD